MPNAGTGLAGELGFLRNDNPTAYMKEWTRRNRGRKNATDLTYYHKVIKHNPKQLARKLELGAAQRRKKKYGITPLEYQTLLTAQGGVCKICAKVESLKGGLRVDHDHKTGRIRGLLCNSCNNGLGRFKDDPVSLRQAATYIETIKEKDLELDVRLRSVEVKAGEFGGTLSETIPSRASKEEGVTTIPKGSTAKRPEAPAT